ncbi:glycoprotein endo-alpha-1,2-mannosidase, partial [Paragonimus westermani]
MNVVHSTCFPSKLAYTFSGRFHFQVCLHIEPYFHRTAQSIVDDLRYAHQRGYTTHPAYFRLSASNHPTNPKTSLPVFFIYDSYTIHPEQWASVCFRNMCTCTSVLLANGSTTIRGKPYDAYMIGLLMELTDCRLFSSIGFNGGYTYFIAKNTNQP